MSESAVELDVRIRMLTEADAAEVAEIDFRVTGSTRLEYWQRKLELFCTENPMAALAAEVDGRLTGFMLGYVKGWGFGLPDEIGWVEDMGVDPRYQRRGIGRMLAESLFYNFKAAGVRRVYTLANHDAAGVLGFFGDLGFDRGGLVSLEKEL